MGKSIIKNYIYNNILLIFNLAYPLITTIYINKIFSVKLIGEVSFSLSIVTIFISLSSLGIASYGTREIAKNRNSKEKMSKIFSELLFLNFISVIFFLIVYFSIIYLFPSLHQYLKIFIILSLNLFMSAFSLEWFYIGLEEYEYITKRSILTKIISFIFMVIFIKSEKDIYLYVIFLILGISLNGIFNIYNSKKYIKISFEKLELKKYINLLKYFYFQVIMGCLYNGTDQVILGLNSTKDQVAYYARSRQLISVIVAISLSFANTIIPRLNNKIESKEEYKKLVNLSFDFTCFLSFPFLIGTLLLSENLLYIIGKDKFLPATNILRILAGLLIVTLGAVFLNTNISIPHNKEKNTFYGNIGVMIVSVVISLLLTEKYGGIGSAIAITIGEFIGILIQLFFIKKQNLYLGFVSKNTIKYLVSALVMGGVILSIKLQNLGYIKEFIFCFVSGGAIYIIVLFFLKEKLIKKLLIKILTKIKEGKYE
ncbi:flippase [Fusobacterium ulcerans]|uniref:flippase n=1 Tax=Fusobacterium ulcerans TaxID=861 RepID=UPI000E4821CE|nr:flippase [Fusobacterium ulcerans]RGY66173.1 flippase [Fusobacterium ulcerans]